MKTIFVKATTFWKSKLALNKNMVMAARSGDNKALNFWLDAGASVAYKDYGAIGEAAMNGHTETLKLLKKRGGDLHAGPFGHRDYAVSAAATEGYPSTLEYLLKEGLSVHAVLPEAWALINQRQAAARGPERERYDQIVLLLRNPPSPEQTGFSLAPHT